MRVVIFGATGNVGSALVRTLANDDSIDSVVGVARRLPPANAEARHAKTSWHALDIGLDPLDVVAGADAVVHLAWKIQPSRDPAELLRTNVIGTRRIADAVARNGVPKLVYASSVGTYAPHAKTDRADESWPPTGIASCTYSRHKAEVETMLDSIEQLHPDIAIVRMRTSLVFQRAAASEIHRLFLGRLLPWHLPRPLRLIPNVRRLQFQATHADDIADAYRRALTHDVRGAFNVAAEPVLTPRLIADAVHGHCVPMPETLVRGAVSASYRLRVQPTEPGWVDMATQTPLMDTSRARAQLGWAPTRSSVEALTELLDGIGEGAGYDTVPLQPR